MLSERLRLASASDAHDPAGRGADQLPFSSSHGIQVDLSQERPGLSGQVGQGIGVHFARDYPPGFHLGGIERDGGLDFDAFGQQIGFQFPLHHDFPLPGGDGQRDANQHDREHDQEVCGSPGVGETI